MSIDDLLETLPGSMERSPTNLACVGVLLIVLYLIVRWFNTRPLANIQGPPRPSWTFGELNPAVTVCRTQLQTVGNIVELQHQADAGELEFKWISQYGEACKIAGPFGVR